MSDKTLFDDLVKREAADDSLTKVEVDQIKVNDAVQPSQGLIDSIREYGVIQPVLLRLGAGKYTVIAGRRRVLACKMLGIETIPAIVRKNAADLDSIVLSVVENIERSDNTLSEGRAIRDLVKRGATKAQIMEHLHLSSERYEKMLVLSALPDKVLEAVEEGKVAMTTAEKVAKLSPEYQKDALQKFEAQEGKLTGKDVDQVKEVRREQAVQDAIGGDFLPSIPMTPIEIAQELIGSKSTDDQSYNTGWDDALNALIARLEE